jgi:drug/metabolite transporter (DMT)-like permease
MTPTLWIAFGFTGALIIFLMISFFIKDTSSDTQYNTLRFLTSLCAGFAGGFFTGEALFRLEQNWPGGPKFAISGTAGCALFFALWFIYPKKEKIVEPKDQVILSIPKGWTFEQAVRTIAKIAQAVVNFEGFSKSQLATKLPETEVNAPTIRDAFTQLKYQAPSLPPYTVQHRGGVYHIVRT